MTSQHPPDPTGASSSDPSTTAPARPAPGSATLPRSSMLKSAARITELFGKGLRSHGALVSVYHQSGTGLVAFVIPKRYGTAVERNRAKRRLREIYRQHKHWFPPERDLVIYIRPKVGQARYDAFAADLERVAARIRRTQRDKPPAPPGDPES